MLTRFKQRLAYLREQPEHVRLKTATRYTVIIGLILAVLWLVIFLPVQLNLFS